MIPTSFSFRPDTIRSATKVSIRPWFGNVTTGNLWALTISKTNIRIDAIRISCIYDIYKCFCFKFSNDVIFMNFSTLRTQIRIFAKREIKLKDIFHAKRGYLLFKENALNP